MSLVLNDMCYHTNQFLYGFIYNYMLVKFQLIIYQHSKTLRRLSLQPVVVVIV